MIGAVTRSGLTGATILATLVSLACTGASPAAASGHRGGTLRLTAGSAFGSIDPQINYTLGFAEVFFVAYDGLVAFRKANGKASGDVIADLADALPAPADDGRTWVFHLRKGVRFSDGRPVTVTDVVMSFRRMYAVLSPGAGSFFTGIVGADACARTPASCALPGVAGDPVAGTVTFHLVSPDPEFLDKLAMPFASVLPADTPWRDVGLVPAIGTGPYRIERYDPDRHMHLVRNPYFRQWSADAQPDGYVDDIQYDFGMSEEDEVTAVENDQYDWMYDQKPVDRLGELGARYTSRTHVSPIPASYYIPMNTRLYPFDHVAARQAVNYAIDRRALQLLIGGPGAAGILCQVLPRDFPAYAPYCPFTKGADVGHPAVAWRAPDLDRARALVRASGTWGAHVTLITSTVSTEMAMGAYLQNLLRQIGYDADLRSLDLNVQFTYIQNTGNKVQISLTDWNADYPAASDYLHVLYGCDSFHPGSDASINISGYCSKALDDEAASAEQAMLTDPAKADRIWDDVDRRITDLSLAASVIQEKWIDIVSTRLGNYTFSELDHMIFSKVWVR